MPNISVIVPVYKVEKYLDRCINSIIAQTYTDFELILIDDGSPDNCPKMCDELAKKDNRIIVIHQENGGLSAARNAGIDWAFSNSNSEWLTFVDSDDWIHPKYLEELFNATQKHNVNISVCGYVKTDGHCFEFENSRIDSLLKNTEEFFISNRVNAIVAWGKLYRKSTFKTMRYPVGKLNEDEFVTYLVLFDHKQIAYISTPFYAYFQNQNSIMNNHNTAKSFDRIEAFTNQYNFFKNSQYTNAYNFFTPLYFGMTFNYLLALQNEAKKPYKTIRKCEKLLQNVYRDNADILNDYNKEYINMYIDYRKHRIHRIFKRIFNA